jgi:hypothetical protein
MSDIFRHLLVLGRPACGKSEFIDFLKHADPTMVRTKLHVGKFEEVDDFPWLWDRFLEDEIWEKTEHGRQYTREYMPGNPGMAPEGAKLFDWCMYKFNEVIGKQWADRPDMGKETTLLVEFSRGGKNGFGKALGMLDRKVLAPAAIFHIQVSREESWRRNVARYQEKQKHSILAHMVPKETYDYFYDTNDWAELTGGRPDGWLTVNGLEVPFVTMNNEPESTDPAVLEGRYSDALGRLWALRSSRA